MPALRLEFVRKIGCDGCGKMRPGHLAAIRVACLDLVIREATDAHGNYGE